MDEGKTGLATSPERLQVSAEKPGDFLHDLFLVDSCFLAVYKAVHDPLRSAVGHMRSGAKAFFPNRGLIRRFQVSPQFTQQ